MLAGSRASIRTTLIAVMTREKRVIQYSRAPVINRKAAAYWIPRFPRGMISLQLRLIARLDFGLGFRLAELCLVVDYLADARKHRAFDPRIRRPQTRAHQRLAAMEIGLVHGDAQHRARQLAELHHRCQQIRLHRQLALAAAAKRLVDTR